VTVTGELRIAQGSGKLPVVVELPPFADARVMGLLPLGPRLATLRVAPGELARFEADHPDWSFYGRDFPSNKELLEARNRVLARHPKTQFILLHVGNDAENLAYVSGCMDRFANVTVELAARIGELGRQPRAARKFFDKYQDRILFGTDAVPNGTDTPQQIFGDELYEIYYRFLETEDEYFDYAPAPIPPQGRWRIYGLGLPDGILKKVYFQNAAQLLKLEM